MGFDFYISCTYNLCSETGRPFYWKADFSKGYDIPPVVVPKEFRRFLKQCGHHLGLYTSKICDEYSTGADNFLDKFPEWSDILEGGGYEDFEDVWKETDHDLFREALEWLVGQPMAFDISWCY
jgi:hypothetical protein